MYNTAPNSHWGKKKIKNKKKGQLGVNNMGKGGRARGKKKKMDI